MLGHDLGSSLGQSSYLIDGLDAVMLVWEEAVGEFSCIVIAAERRPSCGVPVGIRSWEQSLTISFTSVKTRQRVSGLVWSQMRWQMRHRTASPVHCCHVNCYCWELLARGNQKQRQSQHNWHVQLSVGVMDHAVTVAQVVDGNRLPEKMVCEHELTVGQAGEDVSLLPRTLEYDFLEI